MAIPGKAISRCFKVQLEDFWFMFGRTIGVVQWYVSWKYPKRFLITDVNDTLPRMKDNILSGIIWCCVM